MPESWELAEEQEANEAAGEVDYCLEEQLDALGVAVKARNEHSRWSFWHAMYSGVAPFC